jgi:predicted enzyme related to lactoylglutathione lyase
MADRTYTILCAAGTQIGGLMSLPEDARSGGAGSRWIGYVAVEDVDHFAKRVKDAGGTIHRAPADIPGVGRFAGVADPQGASFVLYKGMSAQAQPVAPGTTGHAGWRELHAGDWSSAFDFYSGLFGWSKVQAIDMGPMGTYQLFATGEMPVGAMMTKPPFEPHAYWLFYFNVDGINAAAKRVKDKKGEVLNGPLQVPGGGWVIQCRDPQGAIFALISARA